MVVPVNKFLVVMTLLTATCSFGQELDLSSLDKLESKAKEINKISLDEQQLRAAMQLFSDNTKKATEAQKDNLKQLIAGLKSIEIRSFEFGDSGDFSDADLAKVRSQMAKMKNWSKIVDSKEEDEHSEIFMHMENDHALGLAIISSEKTELSVVFINGALKLNDLAKLGGVMGIPNIQLGPGARH